MDSIKQKLAALEGGRVLDIATGSGSFALRLAGELASYSEIVAVDSQPRAVAAATNNLSALAMASVREANAEALPFPDGSFDLVSISCSLHHFARPSACLAEAKRVLSPGGHLVILEMHREAEDGPSLTHVLLHHWWAHIDSEAGTYHDETFDRKRIRSLVDALGLAAPSWTDVAGEETDPLDPELLAEIDGAIDSYLGKIAPASANAAAHAAEGGALRKRAHEIGFRSAPSLFFVGRKPG